MVQLDQEVNDKQHWQNHSEGNSYKVAWIGKV